MAPTYIKLCSVTVFCDGDLFSTNTSCHSVLRQGLFSKNTFMSLCFATEPFSKLKYFYVTVFCDGDLFSKNTSCHCVLRQGLFSKNTFMSLCFATEPFSKKILLCHSVL
jgi:hypothetical protein